MGLYLGIDGGGTKTAASILDDSESELGRGHGGPCNIATCDDSALKHSIESAVSTAIEWAGLGPGTSFTAVCAGVAGYTAKGRRKDFRRILSESIPADSYRVEPDYVIAYWGASEGEPGVAVIAGTGAVAYGRNAAGEEARRDGRGFLLGDRGSGFMIGHMALINALEELDGGKPLGELSGSVLRETACTNADDLVQWTYADFSPARIASLATVVAVAAERGDQKAQSALRGAARMLCLNVELVRLALKLPGDCRVYALGGLWKLGDPLFAPFQNGVCRDPVQKIPFNVWPAAHDAAYGAALLAMKDRD